MMRTIKFIILIISFTNIFIISNIKGSYAQKKSVTAIRINAPVKIDGKLDEPFWSTCPVASEFVQYEPYNGVKASQETELRFAYDDEAIYVIIFMYDNAPDSIVKQLSVRDDGDPNADIVTLDIVPFNDGINAISFKVTAAGVQSDEKFSSEGTDTDWNVVWESAVNINDKGWVVEFKIPYSAIRFPIKEKQTWGLNVWRHVRRTREWSTWTFVDKKQDNSFAQSGELKGIENIKPPLRLSFNPYVSAYLFNAAESSKYDYSVKAGLDLKYGINESFTLDATLIPDFGQVQSDDIILNLSPYETYYGEKRPFFTEGTELFSKCDIFYTRRIGAIPNNYYSAYETADTNEYVKSNPAETSLINAVKLTGRTAKGLGVGIFNAITAASKAVIADYSGNEREFTTQPLTNYNMMVLDQTLPNNSYISFVNTNMSYGEGGFSSDVSGIDFSLLDKTNKWNIDGTATLSQIYLKDSKPSFGHHYTISAGKVKGTLQYSIAHSLMTDTYNPNYMGYLAKNNEIDNSFAITHNIYKPFMKFLLLQNTLTVSHSYLYNPRDFTGFDISWNGYTKTRKHLSFGLNADVSPMPYNDYYEARVPGRYYKTGAGINTSGWFSSDYRKTLALDGNAGFYNQFEKGEQKSFWWSLSPILRLTERIKVVLSTEYYHSSDEKGYVSYSEETDFITFGNRDNKYIINTISSSYIFSGRSSVSLKARHYWSHAIYNQYYKLEAGGTLLPLIQPHVYDANVNFNNFTLDLIYTWLFAPGSAISIAAKSSILGITDIPEPSYWSNIENTFDNYPSNSLSVKFIYYLDSQKFRNKTKSGRL